MKKMKKMFAIMAAMVMALSLTACGNNNEPIDSAIPQVESIEITDIEINTTDKDVVIEYILMPEGAEREVVMEIADEDIATVSEGKITAIAAGETELTVSVGEIEETVKVTVKEAEETAVDSEEVVEDEKDNTVTEPVESTKPVATSTPEPAATQKPVETTNPTATPAPTAKPTATPVPTAKPTEAPKCGTVGHSVDGTCSVCGSTYTAPKCGAVGHSADGTCSVCGSTYTTPKCGAVGHSADGTCSVCGATYTAPKCGAVGHSVDGTCSVCGSTYTTPKCPTCGATDHTTHPQPTCPVCGSAEHTTHPALDNNQNMGDTHNPGDNGAGDNKVERP